MDWLDEFKNPPARCRIKPFWFWNGDMAEDEIKHQIEEMSDKGLGGAFICARQGQKVPYLSEEWFKKVSFAAEEAVRCGLEEPYFRGPESLQRRSAAGCTISDSKITVV